MLANESIILPNVQAHSLRPSMSFLHSTHTRPIINSQGGAFKFHVESDHFWIQPLLWETLQPPTRNTLLPSICRAVRDHCGACRHSTVEPEVLAPFSTTQRLSHRLSGPRASVCGPHACPAFPPRSQVHASSTGLPAASEIGSRYTLTLDVPRPISPSQSA